MTGNSLLEVSKNISKVIKEEENKRNISSNFSKSITMTKHN
jgi:hypothetical protein